MAETRPRSVSRSYPEEEWERQKENFYHYYIEKNMSLKDAARCMKDNHNFDATPRQWERRIAVDKWGFQKYESREARLQQIQASGRSLLEVSTRGRRRSTASDGRPGLTEDRNMRRFARREVSRSSSQDPRRRAHSVSSVSDLSDQDEGVGSVPPSPGPSDGFGMQNLGHQFENSSPYSNGLSFSEQWRESTETDVNVHPHIFNDAARMSVPSIPQIYVSDDTSQINPLDGPINEPFGITVTEGMMDFTGSPSPHHNVDVNNAVSPAPHGFVPSILEPQRMSTYDPMPNVGWQDSFDANDPSNSTQTTMSEAFNFTQDSSFIDLMPGDRSMDHANTQSSPDNFPGLTNDFNFVNQATNSTIHDHGSADIDPFGDPVHADVHELLQEYANNVAGMVQNCMKVCQGTMNKQIMMDTLNELKFRVQAENQESSRKIRVTLKDVATTQRRANNSVKEVCTTLRKKNETLKAEKALLMDLLASQNSNPQPSFSPSHQVHNPWQIG